MLESLKRLFATPAPSAEWRDVADWAKQRGLSYKRAREDEGFIIEGEVGGRPVRIEWGPPQRSYIDGRELRIRMELKLPSDLQMLLLSRPLLELLEKQTFERFTEGTQTQIDTSSPEEMRWLVMFGKVDMSTFRVLRSHFGAVASTPATGLAWINGPLAHQLERALGATLRNDPPFVLMTLRGRTYLRLQLIDPDPTALTSALGIFEAAVARAIEVATQAGEAGSEWPASGSTAWQSLGTDDKPR
ncbi:MAG: hypothetical protein KF788_11390 [Piscinibacter sp.]|nr:hypothetical protein [Piscinibacter sp.]